MFRTSLLHATRLSSTRMAHAATPRFYSSASGKTSGGNSGMILAGLAGLAGAGYYYYYSTQGAVKNTKSAKAPPSALNADQFRAFQLSEIKDITHNTRLFRFQLDSPDQAFGLKVASCIVARLPKKGGKEGDYIIQDTGHVDFIIKSYADGQFTPALFNLKPGDSLEMKGPIPKFPYEANKYKHIGLIAGITPMIQVARKVLENPEDKTKLSLLFANVTEDDILARDVLEAMATKYPDRLSLYYTVDKPVGEWKHYKGFVNTTMIKETMPAPTEGNIVMICGPPPMLESVSGPKGPNYTQGEVGGALKSMGYDKEHVFKF
ncbi:hypothetical protein BDF19DRAFT_472238 [Syncephalis fuscata]|nr:hypothetical protein BDF19DRAFT_472238 [Syncephalis fuscata]